jgi:quinol monooxygenase YgiN
VLLSPGGLSSPAHRAEIDALIEQHLNDLVSQQRQQRGGCIDYIMSRPCMEWQQCAQQQSGHNIDSL